MNNLPITTLVDALSAFQKKNPIEPFPAIPLNFQQLHQQQSFPNNSIESTISVTSLTASLLTNMLNLAQQNGSLHQLASNSALVASFSKLMQSVSSFFLAATQSTEAKQAALLHQILETPSNFSNLLLLQQLVHQNQQKTEPVKSEVRRRKRSFQGEARSEKSESSTPKRNSPNEEHFEYTREHMEKSLDRILREELLDIYEDEENGEVEQLKEISRLHVDDKLEKNDGSAFRKVSSKSPAFSLNGISSNSIESIDQSLTIPGKILSQLEELAIGHGMKAQRPDNLEKMPVIWQGTLAMKAHEAQVQMHLLAGSPEYVARSIGNTQLVSGLCLRINQRMRCVPEQIQSVVSKLEDATNTAMLVCLPVGETREELQLSQSIFETAFIEYFTQKAAAGIANVPHTEHTSACVAHVFPPGDFANHYLKHYSKDFYNTMLKKKIRYLVVIITPEDGQNAVPVQ
ncbi:unnamed protein product, partial [Mesorhabditis belari]|uniref:SPOC domain-containing protein n=1 Tax=Mesorhabditis belari TaxID=2138241 RepID=A0AAF3EEZ2_9BILA